ncbi:MAG: M20/M25/M40 family metallo-hydrolase [Clostridiales bacterium]|nr:M20/M25/M40 family metallo-hydrolase [Clostridiales bacterium]
MIDKEEEIIRDSGITGVRAAYDNPRGGNLVSVKDPIVRTARECVRELTGEDLIPSYQWASSDTRYFREAGIPAIQFGPSNTVGIHNYNETVNTEDIIIACKVYAAIILELVG